MREYGKVYTAFWTSEDVAVMTEDERTLALYLLTCPHGNMLGCYRLPSAYVSEDLKWTSERVSKGFGGLASKGYIYRCDRGIWVVILRYMKWNQFENPNVGKAAGKLFVALLAPHEVKSFLVNALREFSPTFPTAILDKFEAESKPFGNPSVLSSKTGAVAVAVTGATTGEATEAPAARAVTAADLSIAMRKFGMRTQPADPRLIALAEQGITPETVAAACEEVKRAKPGEEISLGYLAAILKRWAVDAAALKVSGASAPKSGGNWRGSDAASIAKGAEFGLTPRAGETIFTFRDRVQSKIDGDPVVTGVRMLAGPPPGQVDAPRSKKPEGLVLAKLVGPVPGAA